MIPDVCPTWGAGERSDVLPYDGGRDIWGMVVSPDSELYGTLILHGREFGFSGV